MTKVLFVHDFLIKYDASKETFYSNGFSYEVWKRYLNIFDEIHVTSRLSDKKVENDAQSSGDSVNIYPIKEYTKFRSFLKNYFTIKKKLERQIDAVDCVIIRLPSVLGFVAAHICQQKKKKYLVEVVGSIFDTYWNFGKLSAKFLALPSEMLQKRSIKNADIAVYITQSYLQNKYPTRGKAYSGVSNVVVDDKLFEDVKFNKNSSLNSPVKIGMVGSTYVQYKGHFLAIDTIRNLKDKGFNVQLQLVGQGMNEKLSNYIIQKGVEKEIKYVGLLSSENQMDNWYRQLDMYIQPSRTEGHGRSVVEAISNKIPVFTSNVGGLPDSVSREFLFTYGYPEDLSKLLIRGIKDREFLKFNVESNFRNIEKYKKSLITNKRNEALKELKIIVDKEVK